jgi:hypothetical protein
MNLSTWEKLPALGKGYVRILYPDGNVEDMHNIYIDAVNSADRSIQVFSQQEWHGFLQEQRAIDAQFALRARFTKEDATMLAEMGIGWDVRGQLDQEWTTVLIWQWEFQALVKEHGTTAEKQRLKKMLKACAKGTAARFSKKGEFQRLARRIAAGAVDAPGETPADAIRRRAQEYASVLRAVVVTKERKAAGKK